MAKKYNNRYCFGYRSDICGYPFRVSKRFKLELLEGGYHATGSANDVQKVIRDIESDGYTQEVVGWQHIFRTRKHGLYHVVFYGNNKKYVVYTDESIRRIKERS